VRTVSWFSAGAASAVATKISNPDIIAYCETGSEDSDNLRFLNDCELWFGKEITRLRSEKYESTWDVWESRRYISGIAGAPCTSELKINPRLAFQQADDVHIFGYTADGSDFKRALLMRENWPDLNFKTPLIEKGITKAACLSLLKSAGIEPPRVYALGFPNANCIPCCKATSPAYWALIRQHYPEQFERMSSLARTLDVKLTRLNGSRAYIDDIPQDHATTDPIAPECDLLCGMMEQEIKSEGLE